MSENKSKVREFYAKVWNCYDKGAIPGLLHPEIVFRGSLGEVKHGHGGFIDYLDSVHTALLAHLSEVNNTPDRAMVSAIDGLGLYAGSIRLGIAPQHTVSETIEL